MTNLKELPETVGKNGFKYTRLAYTSSKALFKQEKGGRVVAYEIGIRKFRPPKFDGEKQFDVIESFWADEDFGSKALTYPPDLEKAMTRYEALETMENDRATK